MSSSAGYATQYKPFWSCSARPQNVDAETLTGRVVAIRKLTATVGTGVGYGIARALNPATGEKVWDYPMRDVSDAGILTTASDLLFSGNREGYFFALDARTGKELWKRYLGHHVAASPITYLVDGKQYVSVAVGLSLFTFGLR